MYKSGSLASTANPTNLDKSAHMSCGLAVSTQVPKRHPAHRLTTRRIDARERTRLEHREGIGGKAEPRLQPSGIVLGLPYAHSLTNARLLRFHHGELLAAILEHVFSCLGRPAPSAAHDAPGQISSRRTRAPGVVVQPAAASTGSIRFARVPASVRQTRFIAAPSPASARSASPSNSSQFPGGCPDSSIRAKTR